MITPRSLSIVQVLASKEVMGLAGISSLLSDWSAAAHGNWFVAKASVSRIRVRFCGGRYFPLVRSFSLRRII